MNKQPTPIEKIRRNAGGYSNEKLDELMAKEEIHQTRREDSWQDLNRRIKEKHTQTSMGRSGKIRHFNNEQIAFFNLTRNPETKLETAYDFLVEHLPEKMAQKYKILPKESKKQIKSNWKINYMINGEENLGTLNNHNLNQEMEKIRTQIKGEENKFISKIGKLENNDLEASFNLILNDYLGLASAVYQNFPLEIQEQIKDFWAGAQTRGRAKTNMTVAKEGLGIASRSLDDIILGVHFNLMQTLYEADEIDVEASFKYLYRHILRDDIKKSYKSLSKDMSCEFFSDWQEYIRNEVENKETSQLHHGPYHVGNILEQMIISSQRENERCSLELDQEFAFMQETYSFDETQPHYE